MSYFLTYIRGFDGFKNQVDICSYILEHIEIIYTRNHHILALLVKSKLI